MLTPNTKFEELKNADTDIDFDAWVALYESDPDEFERRRAALIQSIIDRAPERQQRRLNGLQFQIDMERCRTDSPLQSCMRISSMMWEKFDQLRTNLNELKEPRDLEAITSSQASEEPAEADVLEFLPR